MLEKAPRARRQMAVHKAAHVSADQLRCERLEAHDAVDEIERDRACPDPDEDRGPAPPLPRIDDLMKHAWCCRDLCWNWVTRSPAFREYRVRLRGQLADRWMFWEASANRQPFAC